MCVEHLPLRALVQIHVFIGDHPTRFVPTYPHIGVTPILRLPSPLVMQPTDHDVSRSGWSYGGLSQPAVARGFQDGYPYALAAGSSSATYR